jgi:hypothetical protein
MTVKSIKTVGCTTLISTMLGANYPLCSINQIPKTTNSKSGKITKNQVRQMIKSSVNNTPLKYIDTAVSYNVTTSGTVVNLNLPGIQGTANGQRTGDEIEIDSFEVREYFVAGDAVGNAWRIIYFQNNGSSVISSANAVLANDYSGAPGVTSQYDTFVEKTDIKIFSDTTCVNIPSGSNNIVLRHKRMKPKIRKVAFNPSATTVQNGQPQVLFISDSFLAPHPNVTFAFRIYYRDA